ncbi:MAG TPA: hypothetical protein VF057_04165 [Thermoanaerobaculia bacterium]
MKLPEGVLGAVDVRVSVEDAVGNRTQYTLKPAMVGSTSRRRRPAP